MGDLKWWTGCSSILGLILRLRGTTLLPRRAPAAMHAWQTAG
jgi:hypothetical protein